MRTPIDRGFSPRSCPADLHALARRVRLSAAVERPRQRRTVGAHDVDVQAAERQPVAGLRHEMFGVRARLLVGRKRRDHFRRGLHRRSVVDERANRKAPLELGHAAVVILVQVRDEEVVDALHAGIAHGGDDAVGIARVEPRITGVDEQRLPGRRDDERGLPAFDVDEVDVERFRRGGGERAGGQREGEDHRGKLHR